jgi:endoglucanase
MGSQSRHRIHRTTLLTLTAAAGLAIAVLPAVSAQAATTGLLRTDQLGYAPGDTKIAYLMTSAAVSGEHFTVLDSAGATVASGSVGTTSRGNWNSAFPDVYPIDFSSVTANGSYHVTVSGAVAASSDTFQVEDAGALYGTLMNDGVTFFQARHDGPNVIPGALNRQPSHLNDASASIYKIPTFSSGGNGDVIVGNTLTKIGGPVDVTGGWFDAGDYLKFTFTTSYADDLLYASARALGSAAPASLTSEAQFGTSYLNKMWNPSTKTLYLQVGIGSGNETTFFGDHDLWRLPQADDSDTTSGDNFAAAHRPVFEAAAPGAKIDPDLVGRVAAAFAFAAQADATTNPTQAATELSNATSLWAMANTSPGSTVESAVPNAYYPTSAWHDAMELGATEIALAQQALGAPSATFMPFVTQAATWASTYIANDSGNDTLNLYDTSALAHADLITAMANAGNPSGLAVTPAALIANLKAQVSSAATVSAADIFRAGGNFADFDVDSHTFGFISTEALYRKASGDTQFAAFAGEQRDWLLGGNAWGSSFMVGVGTTFPNCMQSQLANLAGSLNGTGNIETGAVVNGPNGTGNFSGGLGSLQSGMRKCENDSTTTFTGHGSEYVDDVRAWQTSEPALDMSGSAVLAGALQGALDGGTQPGNDFSLSVSPASGSVTAGSSATATVSTAITSGGGEAVSLSASGLPSGATASFSPAGVTSGVGATATIATSASTPAGTYPITITGTAASGSHTTTYSLTVTVPATNDFSVSVAPASGSVTTGSSATSTVSTAVTSGAAQQVTLSATGLPSGATASFAPASVSAGSSGTLTIATAGGTPAGTYPVTITGTGTSATHTAAYTLTVTAAGGGCTAAQLLGNPGFEGGTTITPWSQTSTTNASPINNDTADEPSHSGKWDAWLNGDGTADTDTVSQSVSIPAGCTTASFSFWLHTDTTENTTTRADDTLTVQVLDGSGNVLSTLGTFSNLNHNTGYAQHTFSVAGNVGQTVTLLFTGTETDSNSGTTSFVIDDTALNVS